MKRALQAPPEGLVAYPTLTWQHYLICCAVRDLGVWAYGQRIHDWVCQRLERPDIQAAIIYVSLNRLQKRGILASVEANSPDGSGRRVKQYYFTPDGEMLFAKSREYYQKAKLE